MATGVVSVAADLDGVDILSDVLLAVACAGWIALAVTLGLRLLRSKPSRPRLQSFAVVAATAVIGVRLALADAEAGALAAWSLAVLLWLVLLLRRPVAAEPVAGSLLLVVATQSIAVLAAVLAPEFSWAFLVVAVVAWSLGLLLYPIVTAAVAVALRRGPRFQPELWIVMGALAIATVAGTTLAVGVRTLREPEWLSGFPLAPDLATWALATALFVPLVAAELSSRTQWRYTGSRWSCVFPLGMYAVASDVLGDAAGLEPLRAAGWAFLAVAVAAWALTSSGLARRLARRLRPRCR